MAVEVMSLYKSFGENKVLEDVNFSLEEGKIYALVGRNGSGKTTLLKVMADIFQKDLGKVMFLENLVRKISTYWKILFICLIGLIILIIYRLKKCLNIMKLFIRISTKNLQKKSLKKII